jgi:predicted SnoaL-like aldol condensation-catalyzing enzyme
MTRHRGTATLSREARVLVFNAALVQRVVDEIWNAGNLELADELFAPTYINHGGLIPDLVQGPEGMKFSVAFYRAAFPGLHVAVDDLAVDRDAVTFSWTASGQATPDATTGTLTGVTRSLVVDGHILESWTSWDARLALERLGVVQSDQSAATG